MAKSQRFRKRSSDRSGFDYKRIELVNDNGVLVGPDELDQPPPSKKSLGGEGDISGEARSNSDFADGVSALTVPSGHDNPITHITAGGGITPVVSNEPGTHPFMRVTGSNAAVDITADPQIAAGRQNDVLTLLCVDSDITLDHGTGLNLMGSSHFIMTSGSIISFIFSTSNTAWNETSRSRRL